MAENREKTIFFKEKQLLKEDRQFRDKGQFPEREFQQVQVPVQQVPVQQVQVPRLPVRQVREPYTPQQEVMTERIPRQKSYTAAKPKDVLQRKYSQPLMAPVQEPIRRVVA